MMDITRMSDAELAEKLADNFSPHGWEDVAKFVRLCVKDSQKELMEALEYIESTAKHHYDEDADENNTSPDDMSAHLNGLIVKKCQQALASVEGKDSHVA